MSNYKNACFAFLRVNAAVCGIATNKNGTAASPYNPTGKDEDSAKPSSASLWALVNMHFTSERHMGIAYCDSRKELLLELNATKSQNRKVLIYNTSTQSLTCGAIDSNGDIVPDGRVSVEYIATLQLAHLITSNSDVEKVWRDSQMEFASAGKKKIYQSSSNSYLLDALYYSIGSAFPNFDMDTDINALASDTARNDFRDITEDVIGMPGEFSFGVVATKNSKKSSNKSTKITLDTLREKYGHVTDEYYKSLTEDEKALIPTLQGRLANFVVDEKFLDYIVLLSSAIESGDLYGQTATFVGPPGLGKSLSAYATAYVFRLPLRYFQGHKDVTASDFIGSTVADEGVLRTNTKTPVLETMRHGGLTLLDDMTYVMPGYTVPLLGIFEAPFALQTATNEVVTRHPVSVFIITANPDCAGSYPMNEAFLSRAFIFQKKTIEDMLPEQIIEMVATASNYPSRKEVEIMYACFEAIVTDIRQNTAMSSAIEPCIRNLISWATQARILQNPVKAALYNLIPSLNISR